MVGTIGPQKSVFGLKDSYYKVEMSRSGYDQCRSDSGCGKTGSRKRKQEVPY